MMQDGELGLDVIVYVGNPIHIVGQRAISAPFFMINIYMNDYGHWDLYINIMF